MATDDGRRRIEMLGQRDDALIERLKAVVQTQDYPTDEYAWRSPRISSPVSKDEIACAEAQLGFTLPTFLRRLYLEVGNGGFGPGYGLLRLNADSPSDTSIVTTYLTDREMSQQDIDAYFADEEDKPSLWPEGVLMICDWGCNIYSLVNRSSPELQMLRMDSNASFSEWAIESPSLQQWLETWLAGEPLFHLNWDQAPKLVVSQLGKLAE